MKKTVVNAPLDTFDDFVDDLLSSDVDLLNNELDFLIIQYLFQSIDLKSLKNIKYKDNDFFAA